MFLFRMHVIGVFLTMELWLPFALANPSSDRWIQPANLPFFRYALNNDRGDRAIGLCSSTGVELNQVDLSGLGPTSTGSPWCVTVTAQHCLDSTLMELGDLASRLQTAEIYQRVCKAKNARAFKTGVHTSLQSLPTSEAVIVMNSQGKSDLALIILPCTASLNKFEMHSGKAPFSITTYLPRTNGMQNTPVYMSRKPYLTVFLDSENFERHATSTPETGMLCFETRSQRSIPGDSGSPAFTTAGSQTYLVGVLTGESEGGTPQSLYTAGLSLGGNFETATMDLGRDVAFLAEGIACSGFAPVQNTVEWDTPQSREDLR